MSKSIKELRTITGLNQEKFAELIGTSVSTIRNWEQGRSEPPSYIMPMIDWFIEQQTQKSAEKNIYIPDSILSEKNTKEIFFECMTKLAEEVQYVVGSYYIGDSNPFENNILKTKKKFLDLEIKIKNVLPILETMTDKRLHGIESMFMITFGADSDEVYVGNEYKKLLDKIDEWDEKEMWHGITIDDDKRLFYMSKQKLPKYKLISKIEESETDSTEPTTNDKSFNMKSIRFYKMIEDLCGRTKNEYMALQDYRKHVRLLGNAVTAVEFGGNVIFDKDGRVLSNYGLNEHKDEIIEYYDNLINTNDYTVTVCEIDNKKHIEVKHDNDQIIITNGKWYFA